MRESHLTRHGDFKGRKRGTTSKLSMDKLLYSDGYAFGMPNVATVK